MKRLEKGILVASILMVLIRIVAALRAPFASYMGFNEAYYAMISHGYTDWTPRSFGTPFYDTPPLLTYLGWMSHQVAAFLSTRPCEAWSDNGTAWQDNCLPWNPHWGWEGLYRMPSILAYLGLIGLAWRWTRTQGVALMAFTPWVGYWMTKNQTDPLLTFFVAVLATQHRENQTSYVWLSCMLGFLSKQTFILTAPLILLWPAEGRRKAWLGAALGYLGGFAWWGLQFVAHPMEVWHAAAWNATTRAMPFGDWREVAGFGVLVGSGLLVLLLPRVKPKPLLYTVILFLGFAAWQAPINHAYYTLPGIALLALGSPRFNEWSKPLQHVYPVAACAGLALMLAVGGDFGGNTIGDAVNALPADAAVQSQIWPQAWFYGHPSMGYPGCQGTQTRLCTWIITGCNVTQEYGPKWDRLFLLSC